LAINNQIIPSCSLTLNGVIEKNKIIATLNSDRIDIPDPKLVFETEWICKPKWWNNNQ